MYITTVVMLIMINLKFCVSRKKHDNMEGLVVNGVDVPANMVPYVATLKTYSRAFCGASIITDDVVLTAAHCLTHFETGILDAARDLKVVVGASSPNDGYVYSACKVVSHPKHHVMIYDIGLVSVKQPFKFGINVQKIHMAPDERWRKPNEIFSLAGFGLTVNMNVKEEPHPLRLTRFSYVDTKTCLRSQTNYEGFLELPKHAFCLIGHKWSGDCSGDSGSGVTWKRYLVGIVSSARDTVCGSELVPSMYTNVFAFRNWINNELKKLKRSRQCG